MTREEMIAALDEEIDRLEHVKGLLEQSKSTRFTVDGVGSAPPRKQRVLSADARKRIAQAQKRRWAKHRAQSEGKA